MRQGDSDLSRLIAAHGFIERGWIQRTYEVHDRVCMLGAIAKACDTAPETRSRRGRRLIRLVSKELPLKFRFWPVRRVRVAIFNDHRKRTKREVLGVFERAIARQLARSKKAHPLYRLLHLSLWTKLFGSRPHRHQVVRPADLPATHRVAGNQWVDTRRVNGVDPHAGLVEPKQLAASDL
jgi:hypothetical protein